MRMGRPEITEALGELARRIDRHGVSARVYIVGGAAMVMAYDADRMTLDIDGLIERNYSAVIDSVIEILL